MSKQAQHTPGPLRVIGPFDQHGGMPCYKVADQYDVVVAVCEYLYGDDEGQAAALADARLIAAAPMGLELAYQVVKTVSCGYCRKGDFTHESSCCMAQAFIAATEGRDAD